MAAAWYRARGALRHRWRATLLMALVVGLAGGAVLATVAGARRSASAYDRFRDETLAADLDVAFDGEPRDLSAEAEAIRALPEVEAMAQSDFPFIVPAGSGFYPYLDFLAHAPAGDSYGAAVDRPRVLEGRLPDPARAHEIAITEIYAEEAGLRVGDEAAFESFAPDQLEPLFTTGDAGPPAGPRFTLVVTAILDAPTLLSESTGSFTPRVFLSPAFAAEAGAEVATYPGGFTLRLRDGGDVEAVTAALRKMFPDTSLEITPAEEIDRKIDSSLDVVVTALLLCALVAAVAGTVAIGQAFARNVAADGVTGRWLAALGMARRERVAAHVVTALPPATLGAAIAVVASVLASPLMLVGTARRAEPDPGIDVDGPVLLVGFVAIVVAALLLAALAAVTVERRVAPVAGRRSEVRPSRALRAFRRTGLPPPATVGIGMAVEPRHGTAWSVRSALLGVAIGAAGVVGVVVFAASIDTLTASPGRYGSPFHAAVSGFSGDILEEGGEDLLADPDIAQAGVGFGGLGRIGGEELNTYAFESLKGDMRFTLLRGHEPRGGAEVVLGETTLDQSDVELGDEVTIEGAAGPLDATVVGTAVFPVTDERSAPGRGVLLGLDDFERISAPDEINADVLISWADGVDVERANAELAETTGTEVFGPRLPSDVNNLQEVEALPRALAVFLALLAALAAVHALVSTVRMRRQDLAVLRTLGFVRRQMTATLVWQASAIGVMGLAVGVPVGFVAGRAVWRAVASSIGVVDDPTTPALAAVAVTVGALVVVNLAAALPSRSARRIRPAAVLRSA
jgi:hypothetical protein